MKGKSRKEFDIIMSTKSVVFNFDLGRHLQAGSPPHPPPPLSILVTSYYYSTWPVPVAARSKAYVYGLSPAEIVGSNPTGGRDVCLL